MSDHDYRPDAAVVEGYRAVAANYSASAVFADAQGRRGVMHSAIKPILPTKLVGPAVTVRLAPGDLQDPLAALSVVQPGDVVVVEAGGETETAVWGGLMGALFRLRGVAGAVVDGSVRDIDENRSLPFQLFSRGVTPRGTHTMLSGRTDSVELQVNIQCGGQLVRPGDMIVGDELGVTVIPRENIEPVLATAREQAAREVETRRRIATGSTFEELLAEFGRI